ncbi:MAG: helix-turn-helix domain-containing protein [Lapillicoccus sp.]
MIEVELDVASMAKVRVCSSPIVDVAAWMCLTAQGGRHPALGDPGPAARFALRDKDVARAALILVTAERRRYVPDFAAPKPACLPDDRILDDQLARVRATPAARAHHEAGIHWPASGPSLTQFAGDDVAGVMASGLWRFWRQVLAEDWPTLRRTLQDQVRRSAETAGQHGVGTMLSSAHPALTWTGRAFCIDKSIDRRLSFVDREMVLVPSLLTSPRITVQLDDAEDTYVTYPVRAAPVRRLARGGTARLLGRGRTTVLSALRIPATTREVARRVRLSESTVSHHLHSLADAGLVHGARRGRHVRYALTVAGQGLLDAVEAAG